MSVDVGESSITSFCGFFDSSDDNLILEGGGYFFPAIMAFLSVLGEYPWPLAA